MHIESRCVQLRTDHNCSRSTIRWLTMDHAFGNGAVHFSLWVDSIDRSRQHVFCWIARAREGLIQTLLIVRSLFRKWHSC